MELTFVTASWKCNSEIGCAVLLLKANKRLMLLEEPVVRFASMSIFRAVLLITALCSRGSAGVSVGKADAKFHSSSSLAWDTGAADADGAAVAGAAAGAGAGVAGFEVLEKPVPKFEEERAAKGSAACAGAANADCW